MSGEIPLNNQETEKHYENVDDFLEEEFGIGQTKIQLLPEYSNAPENETVEAKQLRITQNMLELLKRKNALASEEENLKLWKTRFHLSAYSAPESYAACPGGGTFSDSSGEVKIFFNPMLQKLFKTDYQLYIALEETIHWSQLRQENRDSVNSDDEVDAKNRIIELAGFIGFGKQRIEMLIKERDKKRPSSDVEH